MYWPLDNYSPIGIDSGSRCVKAVQLQRTRSGIRIIAAASIPRSLASNEKAGDDVPRILESLWRQGFRGMRFVLAVPPENLLSSVMELPPKTSGAPIEQIARGELARVNRCDITQLEMACWELPGGARAAEGTHVMAVGLRHSDANTLLDHYESGGGEVVALESGACALARACASRCQTPDSMTGVLDLGWSSSQLLILRGNTLVYERPIKEAGLASLHATLKSRLNLDPEVAQVVVDRLGCALAAPSDLQDWELSDRARSVVAAHADSIASEVRLSMSYAARRYNATPTEVLVTGGGMLVPGLLERVRERSGIATSPITAGDLALPAAGLEHLCAHAPLVTALGLAMRTMSERSAR